MKAQIVTMKRRFDDQEQGRRTGHKNSNVVSRARSEDFPLIIRGTFFIRGDENAKNKPGIAPSFAIRRRKVTGTFGASCPGYCDVISFFSPNHILSFTVSRYHIDISYSKSNHRTCMDLFIMLALMSSQLSQLSILDTAMHFVTRDESYLFV
jgi:hypothetical protein